MHYEKVRYVFTADHGLVCPGEHRNYLVASSDQSHTAAPRPHSLYPGMRTPTGPMGTHGTAPVPICRACTRICVAVRWTLAIAVYDACLAPK